MSLDISGDNGSKCHNVTYFDSFGVKCIPKGIWKFIGGKNITTNIYRKQAYDSIMCRKFCVGFISFVIKETKFLDYTNIFLQLKTNLDCSKPCVCSSRMLASRIKNLLHAKIDYF